MFLNFLLFFFNRAGFSILLNHMSSQGVSSKDVYDTKQYRVLLELHITQGQLESSGKTKHSSVDSYGKKHRQVTALPHVRNAFLL